MNQLIAQRCCVVVLLHIQNFKSKAHLKIKKPFKYLCAMSILFALSLVYNVNVMEKHQSFNLVCVESEEKRDRDSIRKTVLRSVTTRFQFSSDLRRTDDDNFEHGCISLSLNCRLQLSEKNIGNI